MESQSETSTTSRSKFKLPAKSVLSWYICGYLAGFAITLIWLLYFGRATVSTSTTTRWIVMVFLNTFGLILCYSRDIRCTVSLAVPILCSSKGRSLVVAFAFILAATGPTMNIFNNIEVLTTSISCGQMQLKEALGKMLDVMKHPLVAIKQAIRTVMSEVRRVMEKVQVVMYRIKEMVLLLLACIKNSIDWLSSIVSVCNKEIGTPYERCQKIADDAMEDCRSILGPLKGLCHATKLFSMLCYSVKFIDAICVLVEFFNTAIIETVMEGVRQFADELKRMFDVSITFDHDFHFETVASKDLHEVGQNIVAAIHAKMANFLLVFGYLDLISSVLIFTVILKALYFKMKYLRNNSYNNRYITRDFIAIDEQRQQSNREVVLPLTSHERKKYVQLAGCRLTRAELTKIARSMIFLIISCVQLFCICFTDYSLYWILAMISFYGLKDSKVDVPPFITVDVEGGGFVGEILQGIVHAFEPLNQNYTVDVSPCLPIPKVPNIMRYYEIGALCVLAWILLLCQPYGLRLRHVIMRLYYPEVARERALWLYDDILMKRMSFFKFARRKARSKMLNNPTVDDFTFLDWLRAKTDRYWICRSLLGKRRGDYCIICSKPVHDDKIVCQTVGCNAVFCESCFNKSSRTCCVCKSPIEYGDFSDISEVRDSSEEPNEVRVHETDSQCGPRETP